MFKINPQSQKKKKEPLSPEEEKNLHLIHHFATKLPWVAVGAVLFTVVLVIFQLLWTRWT